VVSPGREPGFCFANSDQGLRGPGLGRWGVFGEEFAARHSDGRKQSGLEAFQGYTGVASIIADLCMTPGDNQTYAAFLQLFA